MNRKEIKKILPVIQAFAEGKEIQVKGGNNWRTSEDLNFDLSPEEYRIKPEPKYRPFKSQEECWKEMLKHQPFGWLKCKDTGNLALIGNISEDIYITWATNEGHSFQFSVVFNDYTFTDDTPFGIKEE